MDGNKERYLRSIAASATEQARQVRDLIGSRHWLSDGRHKEALLSALLRRHSPSGTLVTSGFVVHPGDLSICSREQDVLVLDTSKEAPLFHQNGLSIALPGTVLAAVSVKTACTGKELRDSCETLNSLLDVTNRAANPKPVWLGAFFYEEPQRSPLEQFVQGDLARALAKAPLPAVNLGSGYQPPPMGVSCFATARDLFAKVSYSEQEATITAYRAEGLAAAHFLALFIDHVATRLGATEADLVGFADGSRASMIATPQRIRLGQVSPKRRARQRPHASALTAVGPPKAKTKKA